MPHYHIHRLFLLLGICFFLGGCLKDLQKTPSDLSQSRDGYFREGTYYNDVYGFSWQIPGWTPVTPGISLIQRFIIGWDNPAGTIQARLWLYDRLASKSSGSSVPQGATLREAAASIALRQGWAFLESEETSLNGQSVLEAMYIKGTDEKGVALFWMEPDAIVVVNTYGSADYFDQYGMEFSEVMQRIAFEGTAESDYTPQSFEVPEDQGLEVEELEIEFVEHTIRFTGETLALIAQWYTGSSTNWQRILESNPGVAPTALRKGQVIQIPIALAVKTDPLPESFVRSAMRPQKQEELNNDRQEQGQSMTEETPSEMTPGGLIIAPPK